MTSFWPRLSVAALAAFLLGGQGAAVADDLTKVTLVQAHAVVSVGEEVFLYAVPKRLGYFRDEGLDVTLQGSAGGTAAVQALQSGTVEFATTLPEVVLQAREQGGDPVAIYSLRRDGGHLVGVLPDLPIHELTDLKGKIVGGQSWGSGGPKLLLRTLTEAGVGAGDYTRVVVAPGPAAAVALQNKQLDALAMWDSMFAAMENNGIKLRYLRMAVDRQLAGYSLATTDRYLKAHPKVAESMCRAVNKALYFTRVNTAAAIRIFLEEFPQLRTPNVDADKLVAEDVHVLQAWLDNSEYGVPLDGETGGFLPETWRFTAKFYQGEGTLKGTKPPEEGYTNRFAASCNQFDRAAVAAAAKR